MPKVRYEARAPLLELIKGETDGLRIELGVIQKRQLAKPPELPVGTSEPTCEPVRNCDTNESFTAASIKDDRMKCVESQRTLRSGSGLGCLTAVHVEQWLLVGKACA